MLLQWFPKYMYNRRMKEMLLQNRKLMASHRSHDNIALFLPSNLVNQKDLIRPKGMMVINTHT